MAFRLIRNRRTRSHDKIIQTLAPHFDAAHYRAQRPELSEEDDAALLAHYCMSGWSEGLDPAPGFSTTRYLAANPDVREAGLNPFHHYITAGREEGRDPLPPTEEERARARERERIAEAFDAAFYRAGSPDLAELSDEALVDHFMTEGWREGRDPAPGFSVARYLEANADVRRTGENPFLHYLLRGESEGRDPWPLRREERERALIAEAFDAAFYRAQSPDLPEIPDAELVDHFIETGWSEGRMPEPGFSPARYLDAYSDVRTAGINPFGHYLRLGRDEGRAPRPASAIDRSLELIAPEFDADYYRAAHPELADLGDEVLAEIFLLRGWRLGHDPNPGFSVTDYLEAHHDVRRAGVNPLLHYVTSGRAEGRAVGRPVPLRLQDMTGGEAAQLAEVFDPGFYRTQLPDVPDDDGEALRHYVDLGWRLGADPSPDFSTAFYLGTYDLGPSVCPLADYALMPHRPPRRPSRDRPARFVRRTDARAEPESMAAVLDALAVAEASQPAPPAMVDRGCLDLHWVIPDFSTGGGGHMTIFRIIRYLETFGHRCTIWIERPVRHTTAAAAYDDIVKHFQCVEAQVRFVSDGLFGTRGDALIATGWSTAYLVDAARGFAAKYYLVQDHEPDFYPTGSESILARRSYGFDLACICASPWLETMMRERYGRWARRFDLAYDPVTYSPADRPSTESRARHRIAVYGREHTARRCVQLCLLGLERLAAKREDFEVHFFGQDDLSFGATPFEAYSHGVLSGEKLAALYRDCDLGLCVSATNYSLVPQEMMACGLPVVELDGESTQAIFPDGVVTLAEPSPDGIAEALGRLLDDPGARAAQTARAAEWVRPLTWETTVRSIETALIERLDATGVEAPAAPEVVVSPSPLLDVVIPTFDGLGEIEHVVEALRGQRLFERMQIHCVDSSSRDGTTEWLRAQEDLGVTVIEQSAFQHGRTRNFGASLGRAPLVAFLTQDAIPAHADWATDIVKMMAHHPGAAGLFGRHLPYPHHPLHVRREIERHFENMLDLPLEVTKDTAPSLWASGDAAWRQRLYFYSDNNSAMRRDVWREIPYPQVDYGEDQVWAKTILEAGYGKLYAPTATVYHSHDYGAEETFDRSRTEAAFFFEEFGWALGTGSEEELEARIAREQQAFAAWAAKNRIEADETTRRRDAIAARHRGWRAGWLAAGGSPDAATPEGSA